MVFAGLLFTCISSLTWWRTACNITITVDFFLFRMAYAQAATAIPDPGDCDIII